MFKVEVVKGFLSPFWILFCLGLGVSLQEQSALAKTEPALRGLEFVRLAIARSTQIKRGGVIQLQASVRNAGVVPAVGQLVGKMDGQPGEEYRRQIELAAGEHKDFDLHLRISANTTNTPINVTVILSAIENGREVVLQRRNDPLSKTLTLQLESELVSTGIALAPGPIDGVYWRWPSAEPYGSYELVLASRVDLGLSRRCMLLDSEPLPASHVDWKGMDTLIIETSEPLLDSAAVTSMQIFLQRGGHVLVMLDKIETQLIRALLVSDQQCETVDSVELNHFVMDVNSPITFGLSDRTIDRDRPMRMKRVLQQGGTVTHSIDGWPAAISMKIGDGELILTTLESSAWLKPRFMQSNDEIFQSKFSAPLWEGTLNSQLNATHLPEPLEAVDVSYPIELIGSPVVSRQLVGAVLIGFCTLLLGMGLWGAFASDLRWIGVLAPALAIASCVPLVVAAIGMRTDIPSMVSELQFVQFWQNGGGLLRGNAAVYLTSSRSMDLVSASDGFAIPSENIESGIRRLTTEDFASWRLGNTDWPPGTWRYKTEIGISPESFSSKARLTANGLEMELPNGLPSRAEDIVVCFTTGSPCMGNEIDSNSRLLVNGELAADSNRWTKDSIVSDEQRRRAAVYNTLFLPSEASRSPTPRTLFFWTELWPQSPSWNSTLRHRGSALVSVPIKLEIPEVGSKVLIPYSLMKIEPLNESRRVSTIFNFRTGHWAGESSSEREADLSFVLPPEALPLEASLISIDWDIVAPKRKVKLVWSAKDSPIDLVELDSPSIPWRGTINNPRVLKDLVDGRLDLRIIVTGIDGQLDPLQNSFVGWRIKHLRITVAGQTLPRNNLASTGLDYSQPDAQARDQQQNPSLMRRVTKGLQTK